MSDLSVCLSVLLNTILSGTIDYRFERGSKNSLGDSSIVWEPLKCKQKNCHGGIGKSVYSNTQFISVFVCACVSCRLAYLHFTEPTVY